ncbi:hypothetical protein [Schaalia sp. lx-100]|uniref:hypothetical protein n=1 Tax=Schaalia sp. lx-100 TaxID=2899081 RepID=UPI001E527EC4|nr:hypothetical protein [Schaalia sp. lx-100]MCD4557879.1 hypothetical protein [Schaalia sp. lx-100]
MRNFTTKQWVLLGIVCAGVLLSILAAVLAHTSYGHFLKWAAITCIVIGVFTSVSGNSQTSSPDSTSSADAVFSADSAAPSTSHAPTPSPRDSEANPSYTGNSNV